METRQRQTVIFVGFMFIFVVAVMILLSNTGVSGPSLGGLVPESTKQFANDTANAWSGIIGDAKNGTKVIG